MIPAAFGVSLQSAKHVSASKNAIPRFGMAMAVDADKASLELTDAYAAARGDIEHFKASLERIRRSPGSEESIQAFVAELERSLPKTAEPDFARQVLSELSPSHAVAGEMSDLFVEESRAALQSGVPAELDKLLLRIERLEKTYGSQDYKKGKVMFMDWLLCQSFPDPQRQNLRNSLFRKLSPEYAIAAQIRDRFERSAGYYDDFVIEIHELRESIRRHALENLVNGAALAAISLSREQSQAGFFKEVFPILKNLISDETLPVCRPELSAEIARINTRQRIGAQLNTFG